ncbi:hypothetical protein Dimus_030838 [Dionaea muscipula]
MPSPWSYFWGGIPPGKTTFIKHMLNTSYPGILASTSLSLLLIFIIPFKFHLTEAFFLFVSFTTLLTGVHIGPEPTTDRFVRFIKASIPDNEMEKNLVVVSEEEVGSTKWYLEYLKPLVSKLDTPTDLRQHLALVLLIMLICMDI